MAGQAAAADEAAGRHVEGGGAEGIGTTATRAAIHLRVMAEKIDGAGGEADGAPRRTRRGVERTQSPDEQAIESRLRVAVGGETGHALDGPRPASEALQLLRESGLLIVMLTGDSRGTAEAVARKVGIDHVEAEVLPEQKSAVVKRFQAEGRRVAMAGDGVNDAPALAQAEVGIAMGTGTDVAMQSAGITLVKGDLRGIVRARRLSQATMRNIRENLFFAFIYNALGVPIAAGVLYPVFGLLLSPIIASAAMSFSSVSVIANALRLRRVRL